MRKYVKLILLLSVVTMLVAAMTVSIAAVEPENLGGHWVINAEKIDEILAGEAGEKTTGYFFSIYHNCIIFNCYCY